MKARVLRGAIGLIPLFLLMPFGFAQPGQTEGNAPIYRVTVVQRTTKAVNYQYRSGPTRIDFRGTVLLPHAKGEATVESRQGRTEIEAKLDGLGTPQRFGSEYLAYVLWAITPDGRPHNIGELIPDASEKAKIRVTTDLQAFALIVTAEPYSAVRQPSDVVVAENQVRPDTAGTIEPIDAKYELLPRGEYTWHVPSDLASGPANSPKVSMHEYEAQSELYQAQNAIGIAGNANAERYAPDTFARAKQSLTAAQQLHDRKGDFRRVVQNAREAAQTAEDARLIAQRSQQAEQLRATNLELSKTQAELSSAQQAKDRALQEARQAQAEADSARAKAQAELTARNQAESEAAAAREKLSEAQSKAQARGAEAARVQQELSVARKRDLRMNLLQNLKAVLPTLDTGRGLVVTVPDDGFRGGVMRDAFSDRVARVAEILSAHPDLRISVQGYSDIAAKEPLSRERADSVRSALIGKGLARTTVSAVGLGNSRPLGSNATPQGRKENSRVEIVVAGDSIGTLPLWEQTYPLTSSARRTLSSGRNDSKALDEVTTQ
jgi:outer membrane protein OmpA-like peptidoglycan-associated protein